MYVIYPADEVVYLTYNSNSLPRTRQRPTLDVIVGLPPPAPSSAPSPPAPAPTPPRAASLPKTAPPEPAERAPASPTPSLERSAKPRERTKTRFLKKLGARQEDNEFGKIVRTPAPDEFELPAPLPTPAFSRKNIFDRDFDALFEVASSPQFTANIRVTTPEPDHADVSATYFPSPTTSQLSLLPPRPYSEPSPSPSYSARTSTPSTPTPPQRNYEGSNSKPKKVSFFRRKFSRSREGSLPRADTMQPQSSVEMVLRELTHPAHNEQLKNQQQVTFKLVKTVSDFTTQLSQIYERHSSELQVVVANFRKRSAELRKERATCPSSLFHTWETLLQEVEADVVGYSNAAQALERVVATPLIDRTFHLKVQARKLFAHREGCEVILAKADDQLTKSRQDYRLAFLNYCNSPSPAALATYYDSHNNYVQQLTATNAMLDQYHKHTLPTILQELEEILTDVTTAVSEAICHEGEIISEKCTSQLRRYESLCAQARAVSSTADLAHLARTLLNAQPPMRPPKRAFLPPYPPEPDDPPLDVPAESMPPVLRGEMLLDRMGGGQARMSYEQLKKDAQDLELQIKQLQDNLDGLARHQTRSLEQNLFNKVNEIQEEISIKKYDYRATQLHLASVRAQVPETVPYCVRPVSSGKMTSKRNGFQSDDDNIRYKINTQYNNTGKSSPKTLKKQEVKSEDDDIRYMFPTVLSRPKPIDRKSKPKPKIKVNFWSNKQSSRLNTNEASKERTNRRHTIAATVQDSSAVKPKSLAVKVRKRVSFLPSPLFSDNHVPMVTVPDDLTIQLNEEEANDIGEDLNLAFVNSDNFNNEKNGASKKNARSSMTQTSPKGTKRKRSTEESGHRIHGNENELEFFSKYVVQKLRRMETNQRIYSENLINTVLMLGQLGKLNGKSKISEA